MKNFVFLVVVCVTIFCFTSCENPTSPVFDGTIPPPFALSASQIMRAQGITSIHFINYDSSTVNGKADSLFTPVYEFYIDSSRCKINTYSRDDHTWSEMVYDAKKNIVWDYRDGILSYEYGFDIQRAYEDVVRWALGSMLKGHITIVVKEPVGGNMCNVYKDTTGYQEWVWPKYNLPLQVRAVYNFSVYKIQVERKSVIDINKAIPDNVFDPPKN